MGDVARFAWFTGVLLFIAAVPVVVILGAVRFAFSWQPVYSYAVTTYHAEERTGIAEPRLLIATRTIRNYFSNGQHDLDITVVDSAGNFVPLFNDREVTHMRDVKALVRRLYLVLDAAVIYAAFFALALLYFHAGGRFYLLRALLAGSILSAGLILLAGLASALGGFDRLFLEFHLLSFSNDFWQLDPSRDRLVQIFPPGYWFDVTMFVGLLALFASLAVASLSATSLVLLRRGNRRAAGPALEIAGIPPIP
jgi:integral membrane protein (TIGR01906 family)